MTEEELAHALVSQLKSAGVDARATGAGVHWHVDTVAVAFRTLRVHCFWCDREIAGLMLGMNPANARRRQSRTHVPYEGPEYAVKVHEHGARVADGRTYDATDVITCARAWLAHGDLERLVREVTFVGEGHRTMRALASRLDPGLRWEIGEDPGYELWVYGGDRSCEVRRGDGAFECSFFLRQARVGLGTELRDIPAAVAAWLIARVPVRVLKTEVPGVELEPYADVLETDPPRFHWLHVRDRIADPSDVLAPLRDLIGRLATNPVATTFYSYSSLDWLCFSASSHFPWVDDGLPRVPRPAAAPMRSVRRFAISTTPCG